MEPSVVPPGNSERRGAAGEQIGVGGADETVVRLQLAARWAETFAPEQGDSLGARLRRFRTIYDYLDAVTHGIEPAAVEQEAER